VIALLLEAAVLHHRKATGGLQYGLDYIYYAFQTLRGVMLFTVILLLGTGWSTLKPFLSERDKRILYVILPLQIGVNVALAVLDESSEGNRSWSRYRDVLRMFDIACCCAILLPVVWSIKSLKDAESSEGKRNRNLSRLQQFRTFYIAVIAFVYFTRIVVPLAETQLPFQLTWVPPFMYEASAVFFYAFCGVRFRPSEADSMFTPASADADDDAGEVEFDEEDKP
jgi:G protein-coupled receptor 107